MPVLSNQSFGRIVIKDTANSTYVIAGNSSVSNVCTQNETNVIGASITGVSWSGAWAVLRGANTVLSLSGSGSWNLNEFGAVLNEFPTANVVTQCTGTGTIVLTLNKDAQTSP